jgi:hypothetical protein
VHSVRLTAQLDLQVDAEIEAMIRGNEQPPLTPTSALRKLLKPAMLAEEEVGGQSPRALRRWLD